jgi:hypothetical protein
MTIQIWERETTAQIWKSSSHLSKATTKQAGKTFSLYMFYLTRKLRKVRKSRKGLSDIWTPQR